MCLRIYLIFDKFSQSSFQLSVKKDPRLLQFCFISLCDWSRKLAPSLNQSNAGTKNQSHLGQSRFPALPPGCMFLMSHWTVMMLTFFFLTGGCDCFGYVGRQSLITVLFHSMLFAPESVSKKCEPIPQFFMIISQSQTWDWEKYQVFSKLSLKKKQHALLQSMAGFERKSS